MNLDWKLHARPVTIADRERVIATLRPGSETVQAQKGLWEDVVVDQHATFGD
jgi:hypothetical protein